MLFSKGRTTFKGGLILLALMFVIYLLESFFNSAPSALTNVLIPEFGMSYAEAGLVMSVYMAPYALMQVPGGSLSDRWGPGRTMLLFLAINVTGNLAFFLSSGFEALLISRVVMGFGASVIYINAIKLIDTRLPRDRFGSGLGLLSAASPLGGFLSLMGLPYFYSLSGAWRPLYLAFCILMILLTGLLFFIIKNLPVFGESKEAPHMNLFDSLRSIMSRGALMGLLAGYTVSGFSWCFWSWMPKFLVDTKGFDFVEAGLISGIPTITGIAGCVLVGTVSDRLRSRKPLLVFFATMDVLLLAAIMSLPGSSPTSAFIIVAALFGVSSSSWVLPYAIVAESLPSNLSGVGLGLLNSLGYLGSIVTTPLFGALVDQTGSYYLPNQLVIAIRSFSALLYALLVREISPRTRYR